MKKRILTIPVAFLLLLNACSTPEGFENFNSDSWKADRYACEGQRQQLVSQFDEIKGNLIGKKEYVVRNLLGKPDNEELMERNQRMYYYYIESGTQCEERGKMSDANWVGIRINSLGKASEVSYKEPIQTAKPE